MDLIRHPAYETGQRPFMIIWETTQACDLACRHCRAEAQPLHDPHALTTIEAKRLMDQVESFGKPRPLLIFTGGDPFKRSDLIELIRYASNMGLPVGVSPSGTPLLTAGNLRKIQEAGAKAISLSIDGSDAKRHDDFRRVPGSFQWTTAGWKAARDMGLKVQINTTVSRYNLHDLPNIFKLVAERGALTWSLFFLVPVGRAQQEDEITPDEYEAVMHFLYDVGKYVSAKPTEGHHYKRIVLQRTILENKGIPAEDFFDFHPAYLVLRNDLEKIVRAAGLIRKQTGIKRSPMHINAGNGFVFVSVRGEVFPSGFLPISGGNVRKDSLVDIYRNSALFRELRDTAKYEGRCGRCEFVSVCGGSRSRAYAVSHDPLAEEPFCTYEPGTFPFQEEVRSLTGFKEVAPCF
jgi:AdoMet-dependent heme synthase